MATGNMKGNLMRLQKELRQLKYPQSPDYTCISQGSPAEFLPIIHYIMCDYSRPLTQLILKSKIELAGKTDAKFMEGVYKVFRDIFNYTPRITSCQFFSKGFAEHKIIMTTDMVSMVRKKDREMTRGKTVRPNSGRGAASTSKASDELPDVLSAFTPPLNSTLVADSSDAPPPVPSNTDTASVSIVVGRTPIPTQPIPSNPTTSNAIAESLEDAIPRRTRREVKGRDTGYNTAEGSPERETRPVVYDSNDLRTHPVIQDLAVTVADLLNRVRTLEEERQRSDHQNNAKILLLENKVKLLEAQLHLSYRHSSSSDVEEESRQLDTVLEESHQVKH